MDVKPGYKQIEVGVIPEDWEAKSLREGILLLSGRHVLACHCNVGGDGVPYLTGPADFPDGKIQQTKFTNSPTALCREGDILVTVKGSGSGTMVEADAPYCISRQLMSIRVKEWDGKFLFYSLQQNATQIKAASTGVIPGLSRSDILNQEIPIPSNTSEQRAIAAALSDVDALIAALDRLIAKKRDIKQAAMQEMLTGKRRLPGFAGGNGYKQTEVGLIPEDWDVDSLASVTPKNAKNGIVDGPFGSNLKSIHYRKKGIPVIASGYVTEGRFLATEYVYVDLEKFNNEKRSAVYPGDIVMAKIGARCGASAILPGWHETGILSGNALKIAVDSSRHSTYYIWQVLWNLYSVGNIDQLKTIGAQPAISLANLKKLKILLPSLGEQLTIAAALSDMDTEIATLEARHEKTCALKQGMMQELLTGRIRLV